MAHPTHVGCAAPTNQGASHGQHHDSAQRQGKWGGEIKLNNGGAYFIEPQTAPERLPYSVRAKRLDAAE
jgi:hypothetical protein